MANGEAGRPKKDIDWKQFEEMCHIQCTEVEIAAIFGVHIDTLIEKCKEHYGKTFSEVFAEKREGGRCSLRRAQWKSAIDSNNAIMQIFLGKNMLGQADKQEIDLKSETTVELSFDELKSKAKALLE